MAQLAPRNMTAERLRAEAKVFREMSLAWGTGGTSASYKRLAEQLEILAAEREAKIGDTAHQRRPVAV